MAALNKLTALQLKSNKKGRYGDGGGLYLNITVQGSKSWVYVWRGKSWVTPSNPSGRHEMGLGRFGNDASGYVTLKRARELAANCRALVAQGVNPQHQRKAKRDEGAPKTFEEVGLEYIALKEKSWRNAKHRQQWYKSIQDYCAVIKHKPISDIVQADVLKVIEPLWVTRNETARRVLGRISNILLYAIAKELRPDSNPAQWQGRIEHLVPALTSEQKAVKHHAALDYVDMAGFVERLNSLDALAAKALLLLIYTATRTSETLYAQWSEFDLDAGHWNIPADRMKLNKPHIIPLSTQAITLLKELEHVKINDFVFAGTKANKPLSNMSMLMLLRRHKIEDVTPHGMRSTFRSWAHDLTSFDRLICEQALAHSNPDKVEASYLRSSAFEKRKELMQAWADYCHTNTG